MNKNIAPLEGVVVKDLDTHIEEEEFSPLMVAIESNDLDKVKLLVNNGVDVNEPDAEGKTPLMAALALVENIQIAKFLIKKGADVNAQDDNGDTVLNLCVINDKYKLVKLLLKKGADPNISNNGCNTALMLAQYDSVNTKIINVLSRY